MNEISLRRLGAFLLLSLLIVIGTLAAGFALSSPQPETLPTFEPSAGAPGILTASPMAATLPPTAPAASPSPILHVPIPSPAATARPGPTPVTQASDVPPPGGPIPSFVPIPSGPVP